MKRLIILTMAVAAAFAADAQSRRRGAVGADGGRAVAQGKDAQVAIVRKAALGPACLQYAPSANGNSNLGKVFKRQRQWIVPEFEYKTQADWLDELTVTWHVLLDSKSAKLRDKPSKDKEPVPRYSYFTVAVRYANIQKGSHAASCVLHPSMLERYGEPAIIAAVITNKDGDILDFQNEGADQVVGKKLSEKWWENEAVLSAKDNKDVALIARRQGLLDRSKTVFALVNADDYEMVLQ